MMTDRSSVTLACIATMIGAVLSGCERAPAPAVGSPEYEEAVAAFYTGVAAIQVGEQERAERALHRVNELAPREPATAANLALIAFEQHRLDDAVQWIDRAREQAPDEPRILMLAALIAREAGRLDVAIDHINRASSSSPADPRARFLLVQMLEQRARPDDIAESRRVLDLLVSQDTTNTFLLVESARHAARHGDDAALQLALARLGPSARSWPEPQLTQHERVRALATRGDAAGPELTFLAASLEPLPGYARERRTVLITSEQPELVISHFLVLPTPSPRPPAPDLALRYDARAVDVPSADWIAAVPVWLGTETSASIALVAAGSVQLVTDTSAAQRLAWPMSADQADAVSAVAALDFDHDFRVDLALAGSAGVRLLRQDAGGRFVDVASGALPSNVTTRAHDGVWAADVDLDGDLDLVLAPRDAAPYVLRNRGDGTFAEHRVFADDVRGVRAFVWGDLDDDGVPDAVFLDADGHAHVFGNARLDGPELVRRHAPPDIGPTRAIALGDLDGDGTFDLLALREDGALIRAQLAGNEWQTEQVGQWPEIPAGHSARLIIADLDNNGALDVIASAGLHAQIWLGDSDYQLVPHESLPVAVTAAADLAGTGSIELLGLDAQRRPVRLTPRPTRDYHAFTFSPRAAEQPGDRRVNTYGIDGIAEVRAGMLYQKQPIRAPVVHFGIGEQTGVSVLRIIWPNGVAQAEFDLLATQGGQPIVAPQRLKGSCPWLFAFDGGAMSFVTDLIWRTALGLRINAYGSSSVVHSEDWVRLRGDQLAPRDGYYDLNITGELWESHFFDHVGLMVVDHPAGTEVFVDERFTLPPPALELHVTGPLRPIAAAHDDVGRDVTTLLAARDARYVDTFELGEFQGVAREHHLDIDLGADAPADRPLLLVAHGWVYPTDGSINVALGQGTHAPPRGIRVEVPDNAGGWSVVHEDIGMPAGKTKTVLIDLADAFQPGAARRVRLSTNMEIYWDHIAWAETRTDAQLRVNRLAAEHAELRYRGFSRTRQDGRRSPELPEHIVSGTRPIWRDLEGYYTRFGDVRPLLEHVDDRYVIMNAGDELQLRFAAPADPPAGWTRSFVFIGDGWVKDGDYNNGFSGTLLPLPYHGMTDYAQPPAGLEQDPVFRRHADDWRTYHTRYVRPADFHHALSRN